MGEEDELRRGHLSVLWRNVQGRRYPDDNTCVRLAADHGVAYEVDVS